MEKTNTNLILMPVKYVTFCRISQRNPITFSTNYADDKSKVIHTITSVLLTLRCMLGIQLNWHTTTMGPNVHYALTPVIMARKKPHHSVKNIRESQSAPCRLVCFSGINID